MLVYLQEHDGGEGDGTGLTVVPGSHMRSDYGT